MPDDGDILATRVAWLELADERRLVREGYELLDEKRMLLATEIMRQLATHASISARLVEESAAARAAAAAAFEVCGCDGLAAEPPRRLDGAPLRIETRSLLGITLAHAVLDAGDAPPAHAPLLPLPEVRACAAAHLALVRSAAESAACAGNLRRLAAEYARTERRARALENVVLPEVDATLHRIEEQLDAVDQEEAVRVRNAVRTGPVGRSGASAT